VERGSSQASPGQENLDDWHHRIAVLQTDSLSPLCYGFAWSDCFAGGGYLSERLIWKVSWSQRSFGSFSKTRDRKTLNRWSEIIQRLSIQCVPIGNLRKKCKWSPITRSLRIGKNRGTKDRQTNADQKHQSLNLLTVMRNFYPSAIEFTLPSILLVLFHCVHNATNFRGMTPGK
jgi:hypothetical protein